MAAVPAWKRLGLKLKGPSSDASPTSTAAQTPSGTRPRQQTNQYQQTSANAGNHYGAPGFNKRKQLPSASYPASDSKRPRRDNSNFTPSKKSVSFSQDTTKPAPKKPKKKKAPKQPPPPKQPFDLTPALEYLRVWNTDRDTWKFNKNHQTLLIKYLYDSDAIPAADIDAFYLYIRDIKGASRQRLVEQAQDIRKKDMEDGPKGFPEGVKAPEEKQKEYEEMLAELLKKKAELKSGSGDGANGASKRSFDEMEFVLRTVDKGIQQRIVKRMRAETVIDELESSDTGESTDSATASTAQAKTSQVKVAVANDEAHGAKLKSKRKKKLRTADSDSSSSSDSDSASSDSDSDSDDSAAGGQDAAGDSGSFSSDSDSDEEMDTVNGLHEDDSSSSGSSSSSESGSDSESAGAELRVADAVEDTSGSNGDSESSDSDSDDDA